MLNTRLTPFALLLILVLAGCLPGGSGDGSSDAGPGGSDTDTSGDTGMADTGTADASNDTDTTVSPDASGPDGGSPDTGPQCTEQQRICDEQCATCPTDDGIATTRCEADACVIASCEQGYRMCESGCCEYTPPASDSAANVGFNAAKETLEIAVDSDGYPHILFTYDENDGFHSQSGELNYARWDGAAWQTDVPGAMFEGEPNGSASMILDGSDTPHMAVTQRAEAFHVTGSPGNWSVEQLDAGGAGLAGPPAIVNDGTETCMVWHEPINDKWVFCGTPGNFVGESFYEGNFVGMDLAFDTDGQLHMSVPEDGSLAQLWARDGSDWDRDGSAVLRPSSDGNYVEGELSRVVPLPNRQLAVAYYARGTNLDGGVQVTTVSVEGNDADYAVVDTVEFEAAIPEVEFDLDSNADGKIALAYNKTGMDDNVDNQLTGEVWLAIGENGNWTTEQIGTGGLAVSVAIGPFGDVHVAHIDSQKRIQYVVR